MLDEEGNVDVDIKRGWDSVSEDVYDTVNGTLSQGMLNGADSVKNVLFDENGKLNISFKRAWDATMNDVHVHLTEGGIRNSPLVSKLLDKSEEDPLTTYDPSYNNDFTNFVEDVASGIGAFVPGVALAAVTGGSSVLIQGVIFGASTYHSSYNEAIDNGATKGEAQAYALITGSVAALSEKYIGNVVDKGTGIVGKIISKSKIINPTLRSVFSWAVSALGEGAEEMIESLVGTGAKVFTYDKDAMVDVSELLYEGLVGSVVGGIIGSTQISGEYKAYKQDADHIQELIAQAENISSPAEAQYFINELTATSTLIDSALKKGKIENKENAEWLMYHYNAITQAVTQKLPELVAQNGDVEAMRHNIDSIVLKGEGESGTAYDSNGAEIASVLAGTDIQLYEAMLQRTNLDPEVRAELETQLEDLKSIRDHYGLIDYSNKTDEQLIKYRGVESITHNLGAEDAPGRSNIKTGSIETRDVGLLGSQQKYDQTAGHEVLHQAVVQDPKLLTKIMNVLKSEGIDVDAKKEALRLQYYEQYVRDWHKQNPNADRIMGEKTAKDQAHLRAEERLEADLDEEVAAYYFGDVAAELGLGNIVGDSTLDRIMSKAKGKFGVADTDRNLSNKVLSAIAKYNRVQNRKARRAEAEAKKAESAKNKKASKTETAKSTTEQKSTKDTSAAEKSKSQTPEKKVDKKSDSKTVKKSKGKTADTVYKKNTKLKVGDTVGEVTLVADSETGAPVTPRLSASFAREDMPSYIMATIESLGDKELIAALEEEMFLITADSEAELGLHDTIEELSDHVRDGEITPEQAAQVLSDELANPTGADIDTLVERAKLDGVKYSLIGYTEEGIEVYKTSDDILNKSYKKRNKIYLNLVKQKYIGRTARFFKNGHYYYAYIKEDDARKQVYGEKRSSDYGRKALNRTLADGEIFNLLEHSSYDRGALERGKPTKAHNNIRYWDYYVKTVQIDGKVYDLHADVKKSNKDNYVYSL
ncbi:MAG: hypothetical protein IIX09_00785, partial [Clostridia bacterium]|nr:hypothetical protein [Clostridia bacterium]